MFGKKELKVSDLMNDLEKGDRSKEHLGTDMAEKQVMNGWESFYDPAYLDIVRYASTYALPRPPSPMYFASSQAFIPTNYPDVTRQVQEEK